MSQDAGAGQAKRSPAHVYGPMVYQFPSDGDGDGEKGETGADKPGKFPIAPLIVLLVIGAIIFYLRVNAKDVGQLNFKRSFDGDQIFTGQNNDYRKSLVITQARVAADNLYLRKGPGMIYVATYLLPENWRVSLMGDYETDGYGEVWARVLVQTDEGLQEGWVSQRYLR